ncbi:VOC family protein [Microbacterium oleivorans]|uniref:VOC family protein n=1 Tax=Microbacterium TaxID=33882 RepID=UPI00204152B1|nr:VOC family protein [Microbacterium oleivorans]MCM3696359.1 VOC family protein [Microbacterium oleivorans]
MTESSPTPGAVGPLGQISRRVTDIETAVRWYRDVLGLPHLYTYGDLAFFDAGGIRLFLTATDEGAGPSGESVLYFRVDDIRDTHRALTTRGVAFTDEPHLIHRHEDGLEEWMVFFADPEGRPLALMSQVRPVG